MPKISPELPGTNYSKHFVVSIPECFFRRKTLVAALLSAKNCILKSKVRRFLFYAITQHSPNRLHQTLTFINYPEVHFFEETLVVEILAF